MSQSFHTQQAHQSEGQTSCETGHALESQTLQVYTIYIKKNVAFENAVEKIKEKGFKVGEQYPEKHALSISISRDDDKSWSSSAASAKTGGNSIASSIRQKLTGSESQPHEAADDNDDNDDDKHHLVSYIESLDWVESVEKKAAAKDDDDDDKVLETSAAGHDLQPDGGAVPGADDNVASVTGASARQI